MSTALDTAVAMETKDEVENLFELTDRQQKKAFELAGISEDVQTLLSQPDAEHIIWVKVRLSDGKLHQFKGYRVQDSCLLGPYKGGLRFSETVTLDDLKGCASLMTKKIAVHKKIPYGGAKGGLKLNPHDYSERDLETISKAFSAALVPYIGPVRDIPAPDMGSNSKIMDWMVAEYQKRAFTDRHMGVPSFTGKSIPCGGSEGRTEATGYGVAVMVRHLFSERTEMVGVPFAVQGFGNVGYHAALFLAEWGMKLVAVGDHTGYLANPDGINPVSLKKYVDTTDHHGVKGYEKADSVTKEEFFATECHTMIPAALELQITKEIAPLLQCKVVVEGANGPTDDLADDILDERGILVIPDILANSGGVIVSYYEWLQNRYFQSWSKEDVLERLDKQMSDSFEEVMRVAKEDHLTPRYAAYKIALKHLEDHYQRKGD